MNQHRSILKAIALIRPARASVQVRRPRGFTNSSADRVAILLSQAEKALEEAETFYTEVEEHRENARARSIRAARGEAP